MECLFLGQVSDQALKDIIKSSLVVHNHVPVIMLAGAMHDVEELTNYVGELNQPVNYPQLLMRYVIAKSLWGVVG